MTTGHISQQDLFVKAAERTISYVCFVSFHFISAAVFRVERSILAEHGKSVLPWQCCKYHLGLPHRRCTETHG